MKRIFLLFILFIFTLQVNANKKDRVITVGFTVYVLNDGVKKGHNVIYFEDAQDSINNICNHHGIYVDLKKAMKKSHYFETQTEDCKIMIERKKLVAGKNCFMKYKRIRDKEKELYYNKY